MMSMNTLQLRFHAVTVGESSYWSMREKIDDALTAVEEHPGKHVPAGLETAIELRDVSFAYGDVEVLDGLSITIPAGRLTALIGRSGSGKTTILDLITGLHRPQAGAVYVDGIALEAMDLGAWRRMIGYVPQDTFLFHDTLRRNITLGDTTIGDERVERALRDAGAWDFVARDARGLDALIAPQGSNFSGGQRQRLAIARALVKEPALLVLDEATTGLDVATEAGIIETLSALRGRVTVLAISHQTAIRDSADIVMELEEGRVARLHEGAAMAG
jgi:ATP-binding cassette, subfamily C, bacterial